jgi:hypothetical protein
VKGAARAAIAVALLIAAAGCGSSPGISNAARQALETQVANVRAAAVARDGARAELALASLRRSVRQYEQNGEISQTRASEILDAATQVENRLAPYATTSTTTTTTPPEPGDHHDHGKHHGNDKGGNQGDEG